MYIENLTKIDQQLRSDLDREKIVETLIKHQFQQTFTEFVKKWLTDNSFLICLKDVNLNKIFFREIVKLLKLDKNFKFAKKHIKIVQQILDV